MKLFVTGGTGFVGSHFLNSVLNKGEEVVALRRAGSNPRISLHKEPSWVVGDLDGDYHEIMKSCDIFVHLAAVGVSPQPADWDACFFWNVDLSLKLIQQALKAGIDKIIIAGTFAEYGNAGLRYEFIPPDASLEPIGPYATSKAASCIYAQGLCREKKFKLIYLRIFSAFGAGQFEKNLWPSLRCAAMAGEDYPMTPGGQVRDFISVQEVAKRFVNALKFEEVKKGEPFIRNVGTGNPQTVLEFSRYWWKQWQATGKLIPGKVSYRDNEVMRFVPQI